MKRTALGRGFASLFRSQPAPKLADDLAKRHTRPNQTYAVARAFMVDAIATCPPGLFAQILEDAATINDLPPSHVRNAAQRLDRLSDKMERAQ